MLRFSPRFAALSALPFAIACAAGSSSTGTFGGSGGSETTTTGTGGASTATTSSSSTSGTGGGTFTTGSGGGGGSTAEFAAYAHVGKTLYTIDPKDPSAAPKVVGDFDCIGTTPDKAMLDLAVSETGEIWGISYANIFQLQIQGSVVHCAKKIPLPSGSATFFGLTFAPAGVLDPQKETLIAANTAGALYKIDTTNGTLQQHGTFGKVPANDGHGNSYANQGKAWELSGDIVFLANNGNPVGFATVRDCPNPPDTAGCNTTDTLLEIDMTKLQTAGSQSVTLKVRGQIVKKAGCGGDASYYEQTLGIAAWNDKVYGFSHNGAIIEIDNKDGTACQVVNTPNMFWNGAGVTTLAPVIKPPA